MKNTFYINCYADPWVKVAHKLKSEHGFEPIYWVGYNEDHSIEIVPSDFPGIIYQTYIDAWHGRFCMEIEEKAKTASLNIDFLKKNASEELLAIKMMDRMDFDRFSFNFMERQRFFRNLIRKWQAAIDLYKPDLVISPMVPHRVYDYTLYLLCKFLNIPFLVFNHTAFPGRYMVVDNIDSIGNMFVDDYKMFLSASSQLASLPVDITERYNTLVQNYESGVPSFMKAHKNDDKQGKGIFNLATKFIKDSQKDTYGQSIPEIIKNGIMCYAKQKSSTVEGSKISLGLYSLYKLRSNKYKDELKSVYNSLVSKTNYSEKYILFGLHYQPEATTNPSGSIFVDQQLCIEMLLKNTSDDYLIYVKEHPCQFMAHLEGHTSRMKDFYLDLAKNPRIRLISVEEPNLPLIQHSVAIATVVGTIGWESMVYKKPMICFGLSWYENCPLALRIRDEESAASLQRYIENYKFDEGKLMAYLASVAKNTYYAYYYKAQSKNLLSLSEEECINELERSIIENIK